MKKSINAWSIPADIGFEEMFKKISAAGFDGIELNVDNTGSGAHSLTYDMGENDFERIIELSKRFNLPIASISTSMYGACLGSNDPAERAKGQKLMAYQIKCAKKLGADGILAVPGGISGDVSLLKAHENSLKSVSEMKSLIEDEGVFVGLENVWNGFFMSPFDMNKFIDNIGCDLVGAYFDVGNVAVSSAPEHWIEILDSRIGKIHVKDYLHPHGIHSGWFVNLLEGSINWANVTNALRKAGYDGYLTAELGVMWQSPDYLYEITSSALDIIISK